ncbi:MAG: Nif3-like dinuclear metal center hexameric protein [Thiotrichales bacterium]|jgi:dinuclear metal center YbgI/SA1388 family protein|nr:Nif3-like dinuclear metal center hexameric protein [Thiotrichales bacterium]
MVSREELDNYCNNFLNVKNFKDYGPNGLQIEGSETINKIVSGVSANLDLIECAIEEKADAIFVHHGIFWENESNLITGAKRKKIALLINNNINLFGYHLPLDDHPEVGNNIELGRILGIKKMKPVEDSYLWQGELKTDLKSFLSIVERELGRAPQVFGEMKESINKIAWCTGGAQGFIDEAISLKVDLYLSGEVSERTPAAAKESGIAFISAGHHATERYGVQALCNHLCSKFKLQHQYVEVENSV